MPNFIQGVPATGSLISSSEVRGNFAALNARTGKLTPRATFPASKQITIGTGIIYFPDNRIYNYGGELLDLGDSITGIEGFQEFGYFKDVAVVLRLKEQLGKLIPYAAFIEGPEKASNILQLELLNFRSTDIPICAFIVRNNGLVVDAPGEIEPIIQSAIIDIRGYVHTGGESSSSATVGDRTIPEDSNGQVILDVDGLPVVNGITVGSFNGGDGIKQAIEFLTSLGGGKILVKKGYYEPTETIEIPSNIQICGEGSSTIIKRLDTFTGPLFKISGNKSTIENLMIEGPDSIIYASSPLVVFQGSINSVFKECWIEAKEVSAVYIESSASRNICSNNFLLDCEIGIQIQAGSIKNLIANNQIEASSIAISNSEATTVIVGNVS